MTTPLNTWISVKDAMPTENKAYIIYLNGKYWIQAFFDIDNKCFSLLDNRIVENSTITHWMLLSKPTNK